MSPEEHDYIGLSSTEASSSMESSVVISSSSSCEEEKGKNRNNSLNLKETELRLGLPGSESPDRNAETFPVKSFVVSGAKRGFSDAMIGRSGKVVHGDGKWGFSVPSVTEVDLSSGFLSPRGKASGVNDSQQQLSVQVSEISVPKEKPANDPGFAPASKSQVVGWPPVRSFRRNTMVTNQMKNGDEADVGCLYVKVSMDGAPYLRKIDLKTYSNYLQLSSALEKMFRCFTIGQCGSHGVPGRDGLSESRLMDFLHGSEYVLTYEDKDGDWMLVGDVPWEMFTDSCKRLRIMKGSEAIGLAPRAMEKCKNRN